jgi:hypothetical protein
MEPLGTSNHEFNSRGYGNPIYNAFVATLFKRTVLFGIGLLLLFPAIIAVSLWLIPKPHRPLQYMVAGSVATAATLAVGFGALSRFGAEGAPVIRIRIARRSGQSS